MRAKQALLERAKALGKEEDFDEILIPEESVVEMVKGQKQHLEAQVLPRLHPGADGSQRTTPGTW